MDSLKAVLSIASKMLLILAAVLFAGYHLLHLLNRSALAVSLNAFMEARCETYKIIYSKYYDSIIDPNGGWLIEAKSFDLSKTPFGRKNDELSGYLIAAQRDFGIAFPPDHTELYTSDIYLGKGSLCEEGTPCTIYIVFNPKVTKLVIWIN